MLPRRNITFSNIYEFWIIQYIHATYYMTLLASIINSLLLLYWFVPVYVALLFFNQSVSRPPNHSNCPFIAGGRSASSDRNLTKPSLRWTLPLVPPHHPFQLHWMSFNSNFFWFFFPSFHLIPLLMYSKLNHNLSLIISQPNCISLRPFFLFVINPNYERC